MQHMADPGGKYVGATTRLRSTEIVYPVVVGTLAFALGKKATDAATHRWTVYVRGVNNEDLSHVVSKVTFNLHETFAQPQRNLTTPPYEVTEAGWGEFEIMTALHFPPESQERPLEVVHKLRLYPEEGTETAAIADGRQPVVAETRHELVFSEPHEAFYNTLLHHQPRGLPGPSQVSAWVPGAQQLAAVEAEEVGALQLARAKVAQAARTYKQQLASADAMGMG